MSILKTGFGVLNDFALKFYLWHFIILISTFYLTILTFSQNFKEHFEKKEEFREKHTLEINYSVVRKKKITTELQDVKSEFRENVRIERYKLWIARETVIRIQSLYLAILTLFFLLITESERGKSDSFIHSINIFYDLEWLCAIFRKIRCSEKLLNVFTLQIKIRNTT